VRVDEGVVDMGDDVNKGVADPDDIEDRSVLTWGQPAHARPPATTALPRFRNSP